MPLSRRMKRNCWMRSIPVSKGGPQSWITAITDKSYENPAKSGCERKRMMITKRNGRMEIVVNDQGAVSMKDVGEKTSWAAQNTGWITLLEEGISKKLALGKPNHIS